MVGKSRRKGVVVFHIEGAVTKLSDEMEPWRNFEGHFELLFIR